MEEPKFDRNNSEKAVYAVAQAKLSWATQQETHRWEYKRSNQPASKKYNDGYCKL